jgi:hypothetical protein
MKRAAHWCACSGFVVNAEPSGARSLVAYHDDFELVLDLEPGDQLDHAGVGFRLGEHEAAKLSRTERSLLVEDDPPQVFLQRQPSLFIGVKGQVMPIFHLGQV